MQIDIQISKEMDSRAATGENERRLIRIPKEFREICEFEVGDFIHLRTHSGEVISLAVEQAFESDVKNDSFVAYLTSEIYNSVMRRQENTVEIDLVEGITLGCDPELFLIDRNNGVVGANRFFKKYDAVGYDGILLELRPAPSTDDAAVTNNLRNMLIQARNKINASKRIDGRNVIMVARSAWGNLTAGFHLHYGLPKPMLGMSRRFIADQLVKVLDYYVGIPSIIPEGNSDAYRRTVPYMEYGKPGNYRIDNRTLEYRVPGGVLMAHPILAQGILALGAVVMEDIISRIRAVTDGFTNLRKVSADTHIREIYPSIPPVMEIFRVICNPSIDAAYSHLDKICNDIEKMVGYPRRRTIVDGFMNCAKTKTQFSMKIEENWRLTGYGQGQSG